MPQLLKSRAAGAALCSAAAVAMAGSAAGQSCPDITPEHIFLYEDSDGSLLQPTPNFVAEMAQASNRLVIAHGDEFDFVCVFTDFLPMDRVGGAFHRRVWNDTLGLGTGRFDSRSQLGMVSRKVQSLMMFYDAHVDSQFPHENAMAHEFAHRWMCYLPPLPGVDGGPPRRVQSATNAGHFGCELDAQGGAMAADWAGTGNLRPMQGTLSADTGTRFGWLELYLMGFASAAEMDANMSEQRYLDEVVDCGRPYGGPVSAWSSADIVASAGERVPSAADSQKQFRVAWVLVHQPGEAPGAASLSALANLVNQFGRDWEVNTLGRSSIDSRLFHDADCDGVPDAPPCACELTGDAPASVDVFDLLAYLDLWFAGDAAAERTGDQPASVDVFDLLGFLDCWFVGCG